MNPTHLPVDPADTPEHPSVVLRNAALYLSRHGWIQGTMFFDPTGQALTPSVCVMGAIRMVVTGRMPRPDGRSLTDDELGAMYGAECALGDYLDPARGEDPWGEITAWNDRANQTRDAIIAGLLAAADAYHCGGVA